jgi:hypothetical protein
VYLVGFVFSCSSQPHSANSVGDVVRDGDGDVVRDNDGDSDKTVMQ